MSAKGAPSGSSAPLTVLGRDLTPMKLPRERASCSVSAAVPYSVNVASARVSSASFKASTACAVTSGE